ncbi:MAG: phage tail tape measure protein, partial [Candidatus Paceibacterota bacterium]
MADDQVSGEFRFDVTGNGIKRLESLDALLESVNKIALVAVRRTNALSTSINREAVAVRSATAAYRLYTNAINRAAKAHLDLKKAAGGTVPTPKATATGTAATGVSPTGTVVAKSATAAESAAERALQKEIQKGIRDAEALNKKYHANQRKDAAESARIQKQLSSQASAFLAKEDAKRAASAKAAAASEERSAQAAASTAIKQAEGISRARTAQLRTEEKARQAAIRADQQWAAGLSNTRYALYDVSRTATVAAVAMGASVAIPIYMAAKYEKAFASVARTVGTTGDATEQLRIQFEDLATAIPSSFEDLAKIGTLAGQLDIPAAAVADFTKVVAQFSATTNVGVEEAATNLGRLAQLTGTTSNEYANLGSAIYEVGVTSVATESEILDMGSQIATAGDLAGFSNTQIIALAGALASLGVQPEAARGSLQRIFNIIENGATSSTKATQQLTEATGMTIEQMKALWKSGDAGSQEVFSAFIDGLSKMQNAGESTTNFLRDMGVNAVRDQRLLQVLANNTDVYTQALTNSTAAYQSGTNLADAYSKQTDNVADNMTRLINTLASFMAELGQSDGMLSNIIKGITDVGKMWLDLSRNPILGTIVKLVGGLLIVGTAMALSVAVTSKLRGAMYGLVTSSIGVKATSDSLTTSFGVLSAELAVTARQFLAGTLTAETFGTTIGRTAASTNVLTASLQREGVAAAQSSAATSGMALNVLRGIGSFIKFNVVILGITAALWLLNEAWVKFTETDLDKANKVFGESSSGLVEALKADAAEYAKSKSAIWVYTKSVQDSAAAIPEWQQQLEEAKKGQEALGTAVSGTTKEIQTQQQIVIGQNTAQEFRNMVAGADSVKNAWKQYGTVLTATGFDLEDWFTKVGTSADHGLGELQTKLKAAQTEAFNLSLKDNPQPADAGRIAILKQQIAAYQGMIDAVSLLDPKFKEAVNSQQLLTAANKAGAQQADINKNAFAELGDTTTTLSDSFKAIKDSIMAPYEAAQSWRALGEALAKNGNDFDGLGEKAQANVSAVVDVLDQLQQAAGDDSTAFGQNVLGMMEALQKQGINTGGSLSFLGDILNKTLGGTYNLNFNSAEAQASIVQ